MANAGYLVAFDSLYLRFVQRLSHRTLLPLHSPPSGGRRIPRRAHDGVGKLVAILPNQLTPTAMWRAILSCRTGSPEL